MNPMRYLATIVAVCEMRIGSFLGPKQKCLRVERAPKVGCDSFLSVNAKHRAPYIDAPVRFVAAKPSMSLAVLANVGKPQFEMGCPPDKSDVIWIFLAAVCVTV